MTSFPITLPCCHDDADHAPLLSGLCQDDRANLSLERSWSVDAEVMSQRLHRDISPGCRAGQQVWSWPGLWNGGLPQICRLFERSDSCFSDLALLSYKHIGTKCLIFGSPITASVSSHVPVSGYGKQMLSYGPRSHPPTPPLNNEHHSPY